MLRVNTLLVLQKLNVLRVGQHITGDHSNWVEVQVSAVITLTVVKICNISHVTGKEALSSMI